MAPAAFHLDEASAAERVARDRLTWQAWGTLLTKAQYLDRERTLRQTVHGQLDRHTWVLRVANGTVVASCETFRRPLLHGGAVEVVASVFVDPPLRGAHMASRLVDALARQRAEAGIDGLVLFSEVGTRIYERLGFRALPAPTRTWASDAPELRPTAETVAREDLPALLAERHRLRAQRIDVRLTDAIFDWHFARARFYADVLGRPSPASVGARTQDALFVWAPDFKGDALRILDASGTPGASVAPLVEAARAEARRLGLAFVELWDDAHSAFLGGPGADERDEDLPMGRSFTPRGELFLGPLSRAMWA